MTVIRGDSTRALMYEAFNLTAPEVVPNRVSI